MTTHYVPLQELTLNTIGVDYNNENAPRVVPKHSLWLSKRSLLIILLSFGYALGVIIRFGAGMAAIRLAISKITKGEKTIEESEIDFKIHHVGFMRWCFICGALTSVFGGFVSTKFGGAFIYGVAIAADSLLTILSRFFLKWGGLYAFLACRFLCGIFYGAALASSADIFSRWIPVAERSRCMSIIYSGTQIAYLFSDSLIDYIDSKWEWPMMFYITGGCGMIWSVIWLIVAKNEPSSDKFISHKEKLYIACNAETTPRNQIGYPITKILLSPPVWAQCVGILACIYGLTLIQETFHFHLLSLDMLTEIYLMRRILNISAIIMLPVVGTIMDFLQNNKNLKPNKILKTMLTFGFSASVILVGVVIFALFVRNLYIVMICFTLIQLFLLCNAFVIQLNCLYMTPKHSSVLLGFLICWQFIGYIATSLMLRFFISDYENIHQGSFFFLSSAGAMIFAFGGTVYFLFGSSELQPWAR